MTIQEYFDTGKQTGQARNNFSILLLYPVIKLSLHNDQ
jgi:hypothetical protein